MSRSDVAIVAPSVFYPGTPVRGSERIRCDWIAPHIPAEKWAGEPLSNYRVVIFQKVPPAPKEGRIHILDMADPIWRTEHDELMRLMLSHVDAVTVPTQALAAEFAGLYSTPVYVVRDGHDLSVYPKSHGGTRMHVWFGYSDNFPDLCAAVPSSDLTVVSDKPVGYGKFIQWSDDAWNAIAKCDIAILPHHRWKSNNKAVSAWAMGLAVARDYQDIKWYRYPELKREDVKNHARIVASHTAEHSGRDMRAVINTLENQS